MSSPTFAQAQVQRAQIAALTLFAANGFLIATWMSRIPDVKMKLDLSTGQLGILLLAISGGAVIGLPLAGKIAEKLGARMATRLAMVLALGGLLSASIAVNAAASMYLVMLGLFFFGFGNGIWDVSQNLEGTEVEQALGRSIMPWFHAGFSGGTVLGALLGALIVWLKTPVLPHLIGALIFGGLVAYWSTTQFLPRSADIAEEEKVEKLKAEGGDKSRSAWLEPRTLLIGVMVLAASFTEGTANDWLAVAFVDGHNVSSTLGVLALAVFLTAMTVGRLVGTALLDRFGRVPVLYVTFTLAIIGSVLVIFGSTPLAYIGAAIWGMGASLGFPVGMSAAADDPRRAPMRISVVSTIGYTAFLAGPPLLGFLGDHVGILHALLVVFAVSVLAMLVVPVAKPLSR